MASKILYKRLLRVAVSGLLVAAIIAYVDTGETFEILANIDLRLLVLPGILLFVQSGISAYKWKLILEVDQVDISLPFLFKTYLISQFISLFLPSSIGGDVYRVAVIKRVVNSFSLRFSSVIFDRATGLYGLLIVAVVGSWALLHQQFTIYILIGLLIMPVCFVILTHSKVSRRLEDHHNRWVQTLGEVLVAQRRFASSRSMIAVMGIAVVFHLGVVVINSLYCRALGIAVPFEELTAIVPLIAITDMIPISINGIGIRDTAYVFFFTLLEHPAEWAFALSLLIIATRYAYGGVGGLLLLIDLLTHKQVVSPAELRD